VGSRFREFLMLTEKGSFAFQPAIFSICLLTLPFPSVIWERHLFRDRVLGGWDLKMPLAADAELARGPPCTSGPPHSSPWGSGVSLPEPPLSCALATRTSCGSSTLHQGTSSMPLLSPCLTLSYPFFKSAFYKHCTCSESHCHHSVFACAGV
jgi:hypothetical protein